MGAVLFLVPLVLHLTLAYPSGRRSAYGGFRSASSTPTAVVTSVGHALFRDPFLDLGCWSNCTDNSFLVHADADFVRFLDNLWLTAVIDAAVITLASAVARLTRATSRRRRSMTFVLTSASVARRQPRCTHGSSMAGPRTRPQRRSVPCSSSAPAPPSPSPSGSGWVCGGERTKRSVMRLADELGATPRPDRSARCSPGPLATGSHRRLLASQLPALRRRLRHQVEPAGRARRRRRSCATASRWRWSSTTTRPVPAGRDRPRRPPRRRQRAPPRRSSPDSPICAPPEHASWRPPTAPAGNSNATFTTAPSNACWPRHSSSGRRAPRRPHEVTLPWRPS